MQTDSLKPPREIIITNKAERRPTDGWDVAERISRILSIAAIPVVLAIVGWVIQGQLQRETVRRDYVQIAVAILQEPDETKVKPGMRAWAARLLKENSPTKLDEELFNELATGGVTLPSGLFLQPTNASRGDTNGVVAVSPDGGAASILLEKLQVELQGNDSRLQDSASIQKSLEVARDPKQSIESVTQDIRGFIKLSEGSSASITVQAGGRMHRFDFPFGPKKDLKLVDGLYEDDGFFRRVTTPLSWTVAPGASMQYPITVSITAERKTADDFVYVQIDSVDVTVGPQKVVK